MVDVFALPRSGFRFHNTMFSRYFKMVRSLSVPCFYLLILPIRVGCFQLTHHFSMNPEK